MCGGVSLGVPVGVAAVWDDCHLSLADGEARGVGTPESPGEREKIPVFLTYFPIDIS